MEPGKVYRRCDNPDCKLWIQDNDPVVHIPETETAEPHGPVLIHRRYKEYHLGCQPK